MQHHHFRTVERSERDRNLLESVLPMGWLVLLPRSAGLGPLQRVQRENLCKAEDLLPPLRAHAQERDCDLSQRFVEFQSVFYQEWSLVFEVPSASKDHRDTELIASIDDFLITT